MCMGGGGGGGGVQKETIKLKVHIGTYINLLSAPTKIRECTNCVNLHDIVKRLMYMDFQISYLLSFVRWVAMVMMQ